MKLKRTTLFGALLAAGIATGAFAQSTAPGGTGTAKPSATPPAAATPAPPSAGSTGIDKGAGTGAATTSSAGTTKGATPSTTLSRSERRFIEKATQGGMEEIEMSKLAMDKAQNAEVKAFAKRLVDDHTAANAELMKIAGAKGVSPPATVDGGHKRKLERMTKKSGVDFDREYMDDMVDDHQKDVRDFRSMAKSAKDSDLKAFAAKTLPTLEQHLQMAKSTESAVKKSGRDRKSTTATTTGSTMTSGATTGGGPTGTAKSTATPGKDTAATTGTAGPGTGMPTSTTQSTGTAPQPPGSASDKKMTAPVK